MDKLVEREDAPRANTLTTTPALAVQFFLVPLAVVAVVAMIYGGFRLMVVDQRTPEEYLNDIRIGGRERRWPAAYEFSLMMPSGTCSRSPTISEYAYSSVGR